MIQFTIKNEDLIVEQDALIIGNVISVYDNGGYNSVLITKKETEDLIKYLQESLNVIE